MAKQLLKQGVTASAVNRVAQDARTVGFLTKVLEAAEKRLETGQGAVSVREGLAAAQALSKLQKQQAQALEQAAQLDDAAGEAEEIAANSEAALPAAGTQNGQRGLAPVAQAESGMLAPQGRLQAAG